MPLINKAEQRERPKTLLASRKFYKEFYKEKLQAYVKRSEPPARQPIAGHLLLRGRDSFVLGATSPLDSRPSWLLWLFLNTLSLILSLSLLARTPEPPPAPFTCTAGQFAQMMSGARWRSCRKRTIAKKRHPLPPSRKAGKEKKPPPPPPEAA